MVQDMSFEEGKDTCNKNSVTTCVYVGPIGPRNFSLMDESCSNSEGRTARNSPLLRSLHASA